MTNKVEPRTLPGFMELLPAEQIKFNEINKLLKNQAINEKIKNFDEIINNLTKQKDKLSEFIDWLYVSIFNNTQIIDFKSKPKLFSAEKYTKDIKFSIITPIKIT